MALTHLAEENDRLWLVPYDHSVGDPENIVPRRLEEHNLLVQETKLRRLTLAAYRPLRSAEEVVKQVDSVLGDELTLESAFATTDGRRVNLEKPVMLKAGSTVQVTLIWSALEGTSRNYTVFVHLLDENGVLLAQHDGVPVKGTRPTTTWQASEQFLDLHELIVPEVVSRGGRLVVGLYDTETLERLVFMHGRDEIQLTEVEFE